jgi:protein-tyrosine phosphatase
VNQLTPYPLWLGHAREGDDFRKLFDAGIQALVEVAAEERPSQPPRDLIYARFPILDGLGNDRNLLDLAISLVANLLERRVSTLVCCATGLSRSPAIVAGTLALVYQESPEECLQRVVAAHPSDVSPGLWSEVKAFIDSTRNI